MKIVAHSAVVATPANTPTQNSPANLNSNNDVSEPEQKKDVMLSEHFDGIAQGYKAGNPQFKEQYENFEEALALLKERIEQLRAQINKLKSSPLQRVLRIDAQSPAATNDTIDASAQTNQHIGAREYQSNSEQEQIDALEKQLGELKGQEAYIKAQMFKMIEEETERLEREARR
ncbi:hypothetical protein [Pseudoalteromonas sp. S16_S37]|uniref:hypothetical protein n=1 Tax=Pseudoalteromonas sp. S16_S37 TaxID=2720228 RepID=UPI001680D34F|nr:hypothetical protein [Pseudoalteromonas sp. S16_S37]MBD1581139.1 DUF342 domain-containing protein [Pseudoalteromonas sp. S16_S37]